MKKILIVLFLMLALGLSAEWQTSIDVSGNAPIDMNINAFKNQVISGAESLFSNAHTQIDIHVDGTLQISVNVSGELANDADLEDIATTVYTYFNNLLSDCEINIKYEINI